MAKYLLILSDTANRFGKMSPEDMQGMIAKYRAWSKNLADAGKLHGGEKLKYDGGKIVTQKGGTVSVVDGPYSETKEIIGGFYLIEADDYDEAVALTRDCPHLAFGKIEVRAIDKLP